MVKRKPQLMHSLRGKDYTPTLENQFRRTGEELKSLQFNRKNAHVIEWSTMEDS